MAANAIVSIASILALLALYGWLEYRALMNRQARTARIIDMANARKAIASITMTPERAVIFQQLGYDVAIDGDKKRAVVSHPQRSYETTRIYALSGFID